MAGTSRRKGLQQLCQLLLLRITQTPVGLREQEIA